MSACTVRVLNLECLDLERLFVVSTYNFGIPGSSSYVKVTESKSRLQEQKHVSISCSRVFCLRYFWRGRYVVWELEIRWKRKQLLQLEFLKRKLSLRWRLL